MACNRPLLVMSGEHTPIVNFLSDKHCAKLVTDRSVDKMVDWMRQLTRAELQEMGRNGLDTIQKHYTKEIVTRQYADLVQDIIGQEGKKR
jgi:glycosyltransferase involved in cell wall biosynthesis